MEPMQVQGKLSHVIIYVPDMDRAVAFYRDTLGLPMRFSSPEWSEFDTGETTLALHLRPPTEASGLVEPALTVPDIQAFYNEMTRRGVYFPKPPERQEHGWLARMVDVDGVMWSVSEGQ